jgi:DNA-directed RNA polymerase subunit RPC12/RpoP
MALTVCFNCDKTYNHRQVSCPYCGTHNFFSDTDTIPEAVEYLCQNMETKAEREKQIKLK